MPTPPRPDQHPRPVKFLLPDPDAPTLALLQRESPSRNVCSSNLPPPPPSCSLPITRLVLRYVDGSLTPLPCCSSPEWRPYHLNKCQSDIFSDSDPPPRPHPAPARSPALPDHPETTAQVGEGPTLDSARGQPETRGTPFIEPRRVRSWRQLREDTHRPHQEGGSARLH